MAAMRSGTQFLPGREERGVPAGVPALAVGQRGGGQVWSRSGNGLDDRRRRDVGLLHGADDRCDDVIVMDDALRLMRDGGGHVLHVVSGDGRLDHAGHDRLVGDDLLGDEWLMVDGRGFDGPRRVVQWAGDESRWGGSAQGDEGGQNDLCEREMSGKRI